MVFLAGYLDDKKVMLSVPQRHVLGVPVPAFKYFGPLLVMWVLSLAMLVFMKDFGMALLFMSIFVALMYMATARVVYVAAGAGLFAVAGAIAVYVVPHVQDRFAVWLDPWPDPLRPPATSSCSRCSPSPTAACSARASGAAICSTRDRTPVVPYLETDFIFTAIANEMGCSAPPASSSSILLFVWRGFRIAVYAPDGFSKLLAAGLATAFGLQTFIIIGGVTRLIPLTGVTLPVRELRRQLHHRQPHAGRAPAHGLQPDQHHPRRQRSRAPPAGGEGLGRSNRPCLKCSSSPSCCSSRSS